MLQSKLALKFWHPHFYCTLIHANVHSVARVYLVLDLLIYLYVHMLGVYRKLEKIIGALHFLEEYNMI